MTADGLRLRVSQWVVSAGGDLCLQVSLLFFLLFPVGGWEVRLPTQLIAITGLLSRGVLRAPATWLLLAVLSAWRLGLAWPLADNHAFLLLYWCLAVCLSRVAPVPGAALARNARLLVALVFVLALVWKLLLSDDYVNGTFARVMLLGDPRFESWTLLVGGLDAVALDTNRELLDDIAPFGARAIETPAFRRLANAFTWGAVAVEGLVALLFCAPLAQRLAWLRPASLVAFCTATYAIAPVAGFGWLLLAMALALCPADARGSRLIVLAGLAVVLVHDAVPWSSGARWLFG